MKTFSWMAVGLLLAGTGSPMQAADAKGVSAAALHNNAAAYQDLTVELQDEVRKVMTRFSSAERDLGYDPDSHAKLMLSGCGLWAFVPRTAKNRALIEGLKPATRVFLRGVVRVERMPRRDLDMIGDGVDVTISFSDERVALLDVQEISLTRLMARASDNANVRAPLQLAADEKGQGATVRVTLTHGFAFSRTWTAADAAASPDRLRTVRITRLMPGFVVHLPRRLDTLDALFAAEPGDTLVLVGHSQPHPLKGDRVFVVEEMAVKPHGER